MVGRRLAAPQGLQALIVDLSLRASVAGAVVRPCLRTTPLGHVEPAPSVSPKGRRLTAIWPLVAHGATGAFLASLWRAEAHFPARRYRSPDSSAGESDRPVQISVGAGSDRGLP